MADIINIIIEKIAPIIGTMEALEVIITLHPTSWSKKWLKELEKDYETVTHLHCVVEKTPEHCTVSCVVLFAKSMKMGHME